MKKILIVFTFVVLLLQSSLAFAKAKYTFYHILWSMTDVNVQFHIKGGNAYMKSHPDVEIKYVGPESYDPAEHAKLLDTVLEANPDGIAMHISSPEALLPGLKKAKEKGIPFVSTTGHIQNDFISDSYTYVTLRMYIIIFLSAAAFVIIIMKRVAII